MKMQGRNNVSQEASMVKNDHTTEARPEQCQQEMNLAP